MTVLDFILEGIEAELALERELGIRSVECDRTILEAGDKRTATPAPPQSASPAPHVSQPTAHDSHSITFDFVFLHDRALSPNGVAMMAKIIPAMGKTPETAPVIFTGSLPQAKVYIVLGGNALKKWFPDTTGGPGQWVQTATSPNILVTYSPEYILRFGSVSPAVQKLKHEMWASLKAVISRVRVGN